MLVSLLLALAVVTISARICAKLCSLFGQPPVMGEVVAGIALGPSLLGLVSPAAQTLLFPATITPVLGLFAQIGIILYMFVVGLEFDPKVLANRRNTTLAVSATSIAVPFGLGLLLAAYLWPSFGAGTPLAFSLFIGIAISVTAFPVLGSLRSVVRRATTSLLGACSPSSSVWPNTRRVRRSRRWCSRRRSSPRCGSSFARSCEKFLTAARATTFSRWCWRRSWLRL
jgi:Kef-type K+ transport system membrane component KefB